MNKPLLISMVGLPRGGKSTLAKKLSALYGWPVVNADAIRLAIHGRAWEPLAEPLVWANAKIMVRSLFHYGYDTVILDVTNTYAKNRQDWMCDMWDTRFIEVLTPVDICVARAVAEGNHDLVPVIQRMHAEYEAPELELLYQGVAE